MTLFGWTPTPRFPAYVYNSICGTAGAALYADTLPQFLGLLLMVEAVLVSIERCWPASELPNRKEKK